MVKEIDVFFGGFVAFAIMSIIAIIIGATSSCMDDKISDYHRTYHIKPVSSEPCCCIGELGPKHCQK
jgi:uncharacterized membrane protein